MPLSRRTLLTGAAAAGIPFAATQAARGQTRTLTPETVLRLFRDLPGEVAVKIYGPAAQGRPGFLAANRNASKRLFVGSAIKTFALCEALRQADSPDVVTTITGRQLSLNASV